MLRNRRPSPQAVAVLQALAASAETWRYGYELGVQVGLKAGSLYPILMRLSDRGMLEASWEADPPAGRPPRHLYRLTPAGLTFAAEAGADLAAAKASSDLAAAAKARAKTARVTRPTRAAGSAGMATALVRALRSAW